LQIVKERCCSFGKLVWQTVPGVVRHSWGKSSKEARL
jgi:hypothetical protein